MVELSSNPSSDYLSLFREEYIIILEYRAAGFYKRIDGKLVKCDAGDSTIQIHLQEQKEQGVFKIQKDEVGFDIYFPSENSKVSEKYIQVANSFLSQIVELDAQARMVSDGEDYEEDLRYVEISDEGIELHYVAGTVNTEWGAYFKSVSIDNWSFEGLG